MSDSDTPETPNSHNKEPEKSTGGAFGWYKPPEERSISNSASEGAKDLTDDSITDIESYKKDKIRGFFQGFSDAIETYKYPKTHGVGLTSNDGQLNLIIGKSPNVNYLSLVLRENRNSPSYDSDKGLMHRTALGTFPHLFYGDDNKMYSSMIKFKFTENSGEAKKETGISAVDPDLQAYIETHDPKPIARFPGFKLEKSHYEEGELEPKDYELIGDLVLRIKKGEFESSVPRAA